MYIVVKIYWYLSFSQKLCENKLNWPKTAHFFFDTYRTKTHTSSFPVFSRFHTMIYRHHTSVVFFLNQHCYSGNNVLVNMPILFNCSCTVGDRSSNMRNRTCIGQIILHFWSCSIVWLFSFCNFFTECVFKTFPWKNIDNFLHECIMSALMFFFKYYLCCRE